MHKHAGENFDAAKDALAAETRARDSDMGKMENSIQKLHMDSENRLASVEGQLGQFLNDLQKELNQTHKELASFLNVKLGQMVGIEGAEELHWTEPVLKSAHGQTGMSYLERQGFPWQPASLA